MAILLGVTAAFTWAGADFLARHVSRRIGAYRTFIFMQCVGLAALTFYLAVARDPHWTGFALAWSGPARHAWEWALGAALLNIVGSLSLYRAFAVGKLALVTPIAASYPALTVMLAFLSGERLKPVAGLGIIAVLAGVMLAVIPAKSHGSLTERALAATTDRGVGWAITAALGFGVLFWLLGFRVAAVLGGVLPVYVMRLVGAGLLVTLALDRRTGTVLPRAGVGWPLVGAALLDTTAFVANNAGLAIGPVSVVSVIASLFGPVAVLLAWVFLGERLRRRQWLGIALIFVGVALVSL